MVFSFTLFSNRTKILLPPLHIKLGVEKTVHRAVNTMNREPNGFAFFQEKFPRKRREKLKAGKFGSPQMRELMKDPMFEETLSEAKLSPWYSLKLVTTNFLGNHWSSVYEKTIGRAIKEFPPTLSTAVSQTTLSAVTLGLFSKENLWGFEWRAGWSLSPRISHYGKERSKRDAVAAEVRRKSLKRPFMNE